MELNKIKFSVWGTTLLKLHHCVTVCIAVNKTKSNSSALARKVSGALM